MAAASQQIGPAPAGSVVLGNQQLVHAVSGNLNNAAYAPGIPVAQSIQRVPTGGLPVGSITRAPTSNNLPLGQSIVVNPNNMPAALQPQPAYPAADGRQQKMLKLQQILNSFEVSIAEANDLVILEDYEIVCIIDDSGSMGLAAAPGGQRSLLQASATRWDELKQTAALIVDLGSCFDASGLDLFFLNRGVIRGVKSSQDPQFLHAFAAPPQGGTPLTQAVNFVARECQGEKPILLIIFTDGEPNGGPKKFEKELKNLVTKKSTSTTFRVQIMACTGDEDAVGYLNDIDEKFGKVDVTDDYYSEMQEVLKKARVRNKFTRGDWCMKAMLGPVSAKFDAWDETGKKASKRCKKHCDDSDCDSEHSHDPAECTCNIS